MYQIAREIAAFLYGFFEMVIYVFVLIVERGKQRLLECIENEIQYSPSNIQYRLRTEFEVMAATCYTNINTNCQL